MEGILLGLIASSPSAVVAITVTILFLRYMKDDRVAWKETVTTSLDKNTEAITAQIVAMASLSESMREQARAISQLHVAVAKLEERKEDKDATRH